MDKLTAVEKIREAVQAERFYTLATPEFNALFIKMAEYHEGKGPPPSIDLFTAWRESVAKRLSARRQSGFGSLDP